MTWEWDLDHQTYEKSGGVDNFLGNDVFQWWKPDFQLMVSVVVVLGPVGLDSDWISENERIPENERDCYLGVSLESQTTNPNPQLTMS